MRDTSRLPLLAGHFLLGPSWDRERGFIHPTAIVGEPPEMRDYRWGRTHFGVHVEPSARIAAYCTVDGGYHHRTYIGAEVWLMKGVHVGHDAIVGHGCEIAPHTSIGGYVVLGRNVKVGQGATFKPYVKVGDNAVIGMGAVVTKDVAAGETVVGNPARPIKRRESDDDLWLEQYERSR